MSNSFSHRAMLLAAIVAVATIAAASIFLRLRGPGQLGTDGAVDLIGDAPLVSAGTALPDSELKELIHDRIVSAAPPTLDLIQRDKLAAISSEIILGYAIADPEQFIARMRERGAELADENRARVAKKLRDAHRFAGWDKVAPEAAEVSVFKARADEIVRTGTLPEGYAAGISPTLLFAPDINHSLIRSGNPIAVVRIPVETVAGTQARFDIEFVWSPETPGWRPIKTYFITRMSEPSMPWPV